MSSNKDVIVKGIKFLGAALPLMLIGPVVLTIGFKALRDDNYIWISLGILLSFSAIILAFLGVKTILNGFFDTKK
ncbi:MAG: DUF6095 family protein [Flavobacteriaceae bacterium]